MYDATPGSIRAIPSVQFRNNEDNYQRSQRKRISGRTRCVPDLVSTMSEDLQNEVQAINSIYGPDTLVAETPLRTDPDTIPSSYSYILSLPDQSVAFRLQFAPDYPLSPPTVLGTQHVGGEISKGTGTRITEVVREVLQRVFRHGEVCLFDLLEEVGKVLNDERDAEVGGGEKPAASNGHVEKDVIIIGSERPSESEGTEQHQLGEPPPWTISDVITEKKSVFVARAAHVSTPALAKRYIYHLLSSDKKVARATHNITAWRIRGEGNGAFQDCDDDGETAAGGRVLHLMQVMDLWDVVVVVTRWYGGVQLGPDRFRIINSVARDVFMKGGFVREELVSAASGKKKGKK